MNPVLAKLLRLGVLKVLHVGFHIIKDLTVKRVNQHIKQVKAKGAGNEATSKLTKEREFSERILDAEVDDPGLKKERRERWPSRDAPPVVHERDTRVGHSQHYRAD
ncbi:hypothetical protein TNCV_4451871 [Trichonephila clavipes]|nr:hypothetical protein TNCV_4451871 [Trichonephila clavipes]